jgi:hypothetical protein
MTLTKAFDPSALVTALEAAGIADAKKLVGDCLPIVFDWLNTSVAMEIPAPYNVVAGGVLSDLETKALAALNVLEAKV